MKKVGLALSGGAARGLAHIGVLKALEEEHIPVDMIGGTSMGALVGAIYAKERNASVLEEIAIGVDWRKLAHLVDPNIVPPWKGFVHGEKVKLFLNTLIGGVSFEELGIPFAAVAVDIESLEEIIFDKGSVLEAVRASISLPVIFTPVKWQGRFLVDGGVLNPLPVNVVRKMGAEIVIAVNVSSAIQQKKFQKRTQEEATSPAGATLFSDSERLTDFKRRLDSLLQEKASKFDFIEKVSHFATDRIHIDEKIENLQGPNIFDVLMQSLHATEYELARVAGKLADVVITPDVGDIGAFAFHKGEEAIPLGYAAAKKEMPKIRELVRS